MTPATPAIWSDPFPHRSGFLESQGIRLNYLDWGGGGRPLVMIHGIGDDPHIFDDVASRLRDEFRVVAYARRGHGLSDSPAGPYDGTTLTEDLRQVLDGLGIQRASLVGWSMGGNEITDFAGRHPERVDGLVYLDAGYDWSEPAFFEPFSEVLAAIAPGENDFASLDALRAWLRRAWIGDVSWSPGLEAYLRDAAQPDEAGLLHPAPSEGAFAACLATIGGWRRDYTRVQAPSLVLYARPFFPVSEGDPVLSRKFREFEQKTMVPFRRASIERIRRELKHATIQEIPDRIHMTIGVQEPEDLAARLRAFLERVGPDAAVDEGTPKGETRRP